MQQWLCLFAILLSTTLQANFPAQTCWQNKRRKELMLGFWVSLVGTQGLAHCVALTLTFGNCEGRQKKQTKKAVSWYPNCCVTGHSSFTQQPLSPPTTWIFITLLLCPRVVFFPPTQRPVVLCLIGPDIWKGPWIKRKKVVYDDWRTLLEAEREKNGILKEAELLHI